MQKADINILETKQHFEILDGLRGIAALVIVVFHFMETAYTDSSKNFIAHGFLAVDFFFCLSGFVIGYAYDDRIVKMGVIEFFKSRLIRLHPMVIAGSLIGFFCYLFDPIGAHPELHGTGKLILLFLGSILLIPLPVMPDRYFNLFSFNAPSWSLFWEYVANIFYAFILYKISRRYLLLLIIISAAALCFVSYRSGSIMGGWGGRTFWDGCARVSYSFLAGLFVYRSNWIIKNGLGFIGLSLLLILAFTIPFYRYNLLLEPMIVIFYFPLLIALGAGTTQIQKLEKLCVFSGKISYPLYMTHYAAIWFFYNYCSSHKVGTFQLSIIITIAIIFLIAIAYLTMTIYDLPLRKYLAKKRKQD